MMSDKTYVDTLIKPRDQTSLNDSRIEQAKERGKKRNIESFVRRIIDILIPFFSFFILWIPFLLIALWIKMDSSGPMFYRATRVGQGGKLFGLYKFRSMVVEADKSGPGITTSGDSRITRSGRFLRRTKLDELPQLFNVLLGDMSLVGPRPEDPRYVDLYTPTQRRILESKPGITGAASLKYRNEEDELVGEDWEEIYLNQLMPDKVAIEQNYLLQRTLLTDVTLIYQTVRAMFE